MAKSATRLFTWASVALSISIVIFVIFILYHSIMASLWPRSRVPLTWLLFYTCREQATLRSLTPEPAGVHSYQSAYWFRAQDLTPEPMAWDLPYFATLVQGSSLAKLAESSLPAHPRRLSLTPDHRTPSAY